MGAKGINLAEEARIMTLIPPIDRTGLSTESTIVCDMRNYTHATVICSIGLNGPTATGVLTVHAVDKLPTCTAHAPIVFRYYRYETNQLAANGDLKGALTWAAVGGITPVATGTGAMYVIELDAEELPQGYMGFKIGYADPAAACVSSVIAILTGPRYADHTATAAPLYS
jgi:hypothetical protein